MKRPGLYENIRKKKARIEAGSDEQMRRPGSKGAPSAADFRAAAKTAKKKKK
jgi:cysteine sulfinate desulfinase/cysteine desulfurase-like protein